MPSEILFTLAPQYTLLEFLAKRNYSNIVFIVDEHTRQHCLPFFSDVLNKAKVIEIKSGEEHKNIASCVSIWNQMTSMGLDRKAVVINLGGGVIGDMGGFCASTYKRGIDFIQIPTTLLSQVDASVGGKLGIDFDHYKNHIGVFREPEAVIISSNFLKTLDKRELRSGFAEIIKHALIQDADAWISLVQEKPDFTSEHTDKWSEIIAHSVSIKHKVTTEDPTEKGLRKILNFGHTLGHAVESYFLEHGDRLLHGEAIAIGMIMEAQLSYLKKFISRDDLKNITDYLLSVYGHVQIPEQSFQEIITLTKQDKKNEHGQVLFSLLKKIGEATYDIHVSDKDMSESITYYNSLQA